MGLWLLHVYGVLWCVWFQADNYMYMVYCDVCDLDNYMYMVYCDVCDFRQHMWGWGSVEWRACKQHVPRITPSPR